MNIKISYTYPVISDDTVVCIAEAETENLNLVYNDLVRSYYFLICHNDLPENLGKEMRDYGEVVIRKGVSRRKAEDPVDIPKAKEIAKNKAKRAIMRELGHRYEEIENFARKIRDISSKKSNKYLLKEIILTETITTI